MIADRYSLDREIGRGGMGAVWLGRDEVLGRPVALKRVGLMPGADSPDLERADREARLAAMLNHPHVVAVFDLVRDEEQHWLVMEYVEGRSLAQLLAERGPLPEAEAVRLLRQVSDALAAAHQAGIVHRDVKPGNILVTPGGRAKLTDFGIARAQADASLTRTGLVTGSPAYIAPEVASGGTADSASDVWSLGATLYHALAGHAPYDVGDNLVGGLYRIVHEEPPRLPEHGALGSLLEVTMARDPGHRWTMAQVREQLAALAGQGEAEAPAVHVVPAAAPTAAVDETPTSVQPPGTAPGTAPGTVPGTVPGTGARDAARRGARRWTAGATLLGALLVVVLAATFLAGDDPPAPERRAGTAVSAGSGPKDSPSSPNPEASPSPDGRDASDTERELERFVSGYLDVVTTDRRTAFSMLTPEFQAASGGFAGYSGFWRTIADATLLDVRTDPETLEVSYRVRYRRTDGSTLVDDVSLRLIRQDDGYLIADEV